VGRDPSTDVAVLKANASDLGQVAWADDHSARVGHLVLALGRPASGVAATLGVVSAMSGPWRTPAGGRLKSYLQTDVVMYPGFSGGPLVDSTGGVLGINTSALVRGVALTVTRTSLKGIVETLLSHGRIRRGFLGIGTQPVALPDRFRELTGQDSGLLVSSVQPEGPADKAGFLLGDTLVQVDGTSVSVPDDLMSLLSGDLIGRSTGARVVRGGELVQLEVTVGERK
jgi:S1-C subfamily serine protease